MKKILLKNMDKYAIVDDEDYERLVNFKWLGAQRSGVVYAIYNKQKTTNLMHRVILGVTSTKIIIDHKDRNGLNNQRRNLRIVTKAENMFNSGLSKTNTSGYTGVSYASREHDWEAYITVNYKRKNLGHFNTKLEAVVARKKYESRLYKRLLQQAS